MAFVAFGVYNCGLSSMPWLKPLTLLHTNCDNDNQSSNGNKTNDNNGNKKDDDGDGGFDGVSRGSRTTTTTPSCQQDSFFPVDPHKFDVSQVDRLVVLPQWRGSGAKEVSHQAQSRPPQEVLMYRARLEVDMS